MCPYQNVKIDNYHIDNLFGSYLKLRSWTVTNKCTPLPVSRVFGARTGSPQINHAIFPYSLGNQTSDMEQEVACTFVL